MGARALLREPFKRASKNMSLFKNIRREIIQSSDEKGEDEEVKKDI